MTTTCLACESFSQSGRRVCMPLIRSSREAVSVQRPGLAVGVRVVGLQRVTLHRRRASDSILTNCETCLRAACSARNSAYWSGAVGQFLFCASWQESGYLFPPIEAGDHVGILNKQAEPLEEAWWDGASAGGQREDVYIGT